MMINFTYHRPDLIPADTFMHHSDHRPFAHALVSHIAMPVWLLALWLNFCSCTSNVCSMPRVLAVRSTAILYSVSKPLV